eukprot:COSAG01_NODE_70296_length_259_cov_0.606250_1_plen_22_part_01
MLSDTGQGQVAVVYLAQAVVAG